MKKIVFNEESIIKIVVVNYDNREFEIYKESTWGSKGLLAKIYSLKLTICFLKELGISTTADDIKE